MAFYSNIIASLVYGAEFEEESSCLDVVPPALHLFSFLVFFGRGVK